MRCQYIQTKKRQKHRHKFAHINLHITIYHIINNNIIFFCVQIRARAPVRSCLCVCFALLCIQNGIRTLIVLCMRMGCRNRQYKMLTMTATYVCVKVCFYGATIRERFIAQCLFSLQVSNEALKYTRMRISMLYLSLCDYVCALAFALV